MKRLHPDSRLQSGATLLEVLVAALLIAILLVPMMDALVGANASSSQHETLSEQRYRLEAKVEEVLAETHSALEQSAVDAGSPSTATTYSDAPGTGNRRLVYLSQYDGDDADGDGNPFTGVDAGLIWVRVEIEGSLLSLETLISQ